jgi:hypothetical protein
VTVAVFPATALPLALVIAAIRTWYEVPFASPEIVVDDVDL